MVVKSIVVGILFVFILIYLISSQPALMQRIAKAKNESKNIFFQADKHRYGDLYKISYLPSFNFVIPSYEMRSVSSSKKDIVFYALGDSYTEGMIHNENFYGVDKIQFVAWKDSSQTITLDTDMRNILLIETTERAFLSRFGNSNTIKYPFKPASNLVVKKVGTLRSNFFNKNISENLEFILFDNVVCRKIKEIKANMSYRLFNYLPSSVIMSGDKKNLFLKSTVDSTFITPGEWASFKGVPDSLLINCILNCNRIDSLYRQEGFTDVFFSIIPNPVTVIGYPPYTYNLMLPNIEQSRLKKFKTIDVYTDFLMNREKVFLPSETHWSPIGLQIWIDKVNSRLAVEGYTNKN